MSLGLTAILSPDQAIRDHIPTDIGLNAKHSTHRSVTSPTCLRCRWQDRSANNDRLEAQVLRRDRPRRPRSVVVTVTHYAVAPRDELDYLFKFYHEREKGRKEGLVQCLQGRQLLLKAIVWRPSHEFGMPISTHEKNTFTPRASSANTSLLSYLILLLSGFRSPAPTRMIIFGSVCSLRCCVVAEQ
jgi:hypothetical protein